MENRAENFDSMTRKLFFKQDFHSGRSKKFGFVEFESPESAEKVLAEPNHFIDGAKVRGGIIIEGRGCLFFSSVPGGGGYFLVSFFSVISLIYMYIFPYTCTCYHLKVGFYLSPSLS